MTVKYHTPELANAGQIGLCVHCKKPPILDPNKEYEVYDACLGKLPGNIMNACCGHGRDEQAYIQFTDTDTIISGTVARELQREIKE